MSLQFPIFNNLRLVGKPSSPAFTMSNLRNFPVVPGESLRQQVPPLRFAPVGMTIP